MNALITKHKLDFETAPYELNIDPNVIWTRFRVGTCTGLFSCDEDCFKILAITNSKPNNGHLIDVIEWFEFSCKNYSKNLKIMELMNQDFKSHLIDKRGFEELTQQDVIKIFRK